MGTDVQLTARQIATRIKEQLDKDIRPDVEWMAKEIAFLVGIAESNSKYEERSRVMEIVRTHIGCLALGNEYLPEETPVQFIRELYEGIEEAVNK